MLHYTVKDLMVPISEYAAVPLGTTLLDAILVLEQAQEAFDYGKYQHRAILVLDESDTVVGKISQLRVLKALVAYEDDESEIDELIKYKFGEAYIEGQREKMRLNYSILDKKALANAAGKKVEQFMQKPTPGEFVAESSTLDVAIHKLVAGTHLSLLVTREHEIIGVLRMADVFAATFHAMKTREKAEVSSKEKKKNVARKKKKR